MPAGNVSIQTLGGGSTLGVIPASGYGFSFLNPLYRYANLTLPFSPNDPGLSFTYNNSSLAPVVLLYARFFNLLNEPSVPVVANVGTTAFSITGGQLATDCLDVRSFGAIGDGVADDTAAIQAALDQAHKNYLGNQQSTNTSATVQSQLVQKVTGHVENGSASSLILTPLIAPKIGNTLILSFSAFDYGGTSQPTPSVSDNRGNTWVLDSVVANGQLFFYTYHAQVTASGIPTVTIQMAQIRFNSFISAVLGEFSGLLLPVMVDGSATSVVASSTSFKAPFLNSTNHGDLVIYSVGLDFAAGVTPVPPGDFTLVAGQANPQPNGLNGAVPVTAMAFKNWNGVTGINSSWVAVGYGGCAMLVAYRQVALPPQQPGKTVVCIPNGVRCMVSPKSATFDHDASDILWQNSYSLRYRSMAYSLVMDDGVTLRIDGSLIANPNATATGFAATRFGWVLITNAAWLTNSTISTSLANTGLSSPEIIPWNSYLNGSAFNEGSRNTGIRITGSGAVYLNGQVQANLQLTTVSPSFPAVGLARFYCVDNSSIDSIEIVSPFTMAIEWGHSVNATVNGLYIHDAPNVPHDGVISTNLFAGLPILDIAGGTSIGDPGVAPVGASITTSVTAARQNELAIAVATGKQNAVTATGQAPDGTWASVGPNGNIFEKVIAASGLLAVTQAFGLGAGPNLNPAAQIAFLLGTNGTPPVFTLRGSGSGGTTLHPTQFTPTDRSTLLFISNGTGFHSGVNFPFTYTISDDQGNAWTQIINQFAQGNGGNDCQVLVAMAQNVVGKPTNITVQFGAGGSGGNAWVVLQVDNAAALIPFVGGMIEMDMLRSSKITNNIISSCPQSIGVIDWAGNKNTVSGNKISSCYGGYQYNDIGGEWAWDFIVPKVGGVFTPTVNGLTYTNVTHDTEITQNTVIGCATQSPITFSTVPAGATLPVQGDVGSDGFGFQSGVVALEINDVSTLPVTGTSFHDNVASGNSTDIFYGPLTAFRSLVNNTFGGGGSSVSNGVNTVTGEVPSGSINGVNANFVLQHTPVSGTIFVYVNGLQQVAGTDFTVSGKTITFVTAPNAGSTVTVNYQFLSGN